jgi:hypothetical protein
VALTQRPPASFGPQPQPTPEVAAHPRRSSGGFPLRWSFGLACAGLALGLSVPLAAHDALVAFTYVTTHAQGGALPSDFLNYYTAGHTLLVQPEALYAPQLEAALQRNLTGQLDLYAQYQNLPQVALLFVPLAWLPYGQAYLVWATLNLALLAASAWLVAPRLARWPRWAACSSWVLIVLAGYAPAQLALIDGQTAFLALFGFCAWAACIERSRAGAGASGPAGRGALWLLTWAWKPQLLPMPLLALVLSRSVGRALLLVGLQVLALALVIVWSGPQLVQRYVTLTRSAAGESASGQTVFGVAQVVGQADLLVTACAGLGAALVAAAIISIWWGGPRDDARRLLQLASLPLASVLLAPRAYAYELTLWLATAWLVLRFGLEVRGGRHRWLLPSLLGLTWLAAVLITLSSGAGVPWAALAGIGLLAALVRQYHAPPWAEP